MSPTRKVSLIGPSLMGQCSNLLTSLRPVRTHLYGRRMYETMTCWETDSQFAARSPGCAAFSKICALVADVAGYPSKIGR
jgi:hypothetical protein